jgi:hypothetical protein
MAALEFLLEEIGESGTESVAREGSAGCAQSLSGTVDLLDQRFIESQMDCSHFSRRSNR